MSATSWTDDRVETLKQLWAAGLSASEIAARLGGVTRNAVLGKLHRLGLLGSRPRTPARGQRPRPVRAPRPKRERPAQCPSGHVVQPLSSEESGVVAGVQELRPRHCRWPIGDPLSPDFSFCGRHADSGPYCPAHRAVAYRPSAAVGTRAKRAA